MRASLRFLVVALTLTLPALTLITAGPAQATTETAADQYLDALVSHDSSAVPLTADVRRVENGIVTARSAPELHHDLDTSVKYVIITGLRDRRYTKVEGGTRVRYLLDVGWAGSTWLTVKVDETFLMRGNDIRYIEATISA